MSEWNPSDAVALALFSVVLGYFMGLWAGRPRA